MRIKRYLKPLYPPLAAVIMLVLSSAVSYSNHDNERDPFRFGAARASQPAYESEEGYDGPFLQMILITGRSRIAVFNGRRYQKGDSIGEFTVTNIEFNKVTMENGEDKKIFTLHAE